MQVRKILRNLINGWALLKKIAQELDGKFNSLAGEVIKAYYKPIIKN